MARIRVRVIVDGECSGEILFVNSKISFFGEVDPVKGIIRGIDEPIKGRALVFHGGRGSTVGSYIIYALKHYGNQPSCMLVEKAEPIIIVGSILGEIPLFETGDFNTVRRLFFEGARRLVHRRGEEYVEIW